MSSLKTLYTQLTGQTASAGQIISLKNNFNADALPTVDGLPNRLEIMSMNALKNKFPMTVCNIVFTQTTETDATLSWDGGYYTYANIAWPGGSTNVDLLCGILLLLYTH